MSTTTGTTISVCVDCYFAANGADTDSDCIDRDPLSLLEGQEFTPGCLDCEPCEHPDCGPAPMCDCGWNDRGHGFSWSTCQGCGSTLGGDRFALTVWEAP